MIIRDAQPADIPGITAIYNDAVEHSVAIWNEVTVDEANRLAWLGARRERGFPVLVAVDDSGAGDRGADAADRVLGYASYGDWRPFDGYRHTVEHSVYVRGDQQGRGIGKALMAQLIERAQASGLHVMVAAIEASNDTSIALHRRLGFQSVGHLDQVGTKFGRWLDLEFMQLMLD